MILDALVGEAEDDEDEREDGVSEPFPYVNFVELRTGVFAAQKIPKGTFVGIYSGELLTEEESEKRGL